MKKTAVNFSWIYLSNQNWLSTQINFSDSSTICSYTYTNVLVYCIQKLKIYVMVIMWFLFFFFFLEKHKWSLLQPSCIWMWINLWFLAKSLIIVLLTALPDVKKLTRKWLASKQIANIEIKKTVLDGVLKAMARKDIGCRLLTFQQNFITL